MHDLPTPSIDATTAAQTAADTLQTVGAAPSPSLFVQILTTFSTWAVPVLLVVIPVVGIVRKVRVYEVFVEGAKEGFNVAVRIIPYLVAILTAVGMFRASGAMDFLVSILSPITNGVGMPAENLPVALMRPLSGSGTLGLVSDLIHRFGVDSFIARLGATMYGSTETTFYVLAVYFGAVGIRKTRHAVAVGLVADAVGILTAVLICRMVF